MLEFIPYKRFQEIYHLKITYVCKELPGEIGIVYNSTYSNKLDLFARYLCHQNALNLEGLYISKPLKKKSYFKEKIFGELKTGEGGLW